MKKLVATAPDKVEVVEVETPEVGPRQVLVRSVRSLISPGSELNRVRRLPGDADDKWPNPDLGYAICGEVVEVGPEVEGLTMGERVMTMQNHQEYVVGTDDPEARHAVLPLPEGLTWDQSPFMAWGQSCHNWTMKAGIKLGETVAVVGLGLVGLLMVMWSRLRGPRRIIGIDLDQSRLDLAARIGCDHPINAAQVDPVEAVSELTGGRMADCTMHCAAGPHVEAFETSQRVTRSQGRVVLIGIHSQPLTILRHEFLWKDLLGGCTD